MRELLAALAAEEGPERYRLYARERWTELPGQRFAWSLSRAPDPAWHLATAARASRSCAAFLSTNSYLTAWTTTVPTAIFVHDLVAWMRGAEAQARAARIERATIGPALRRAAVLICNSEATRRDLVEHFPRVAARAMTIPLAADPRFAEPVEPALLDRPYVLAVGTPEPRKNLLRLIEAFAALPDDLREGHVLALVGPRGWEDETVLREAASRPDDVAVLGHVDEERLHGLYAGAACFAYPSLYEGFGLPVLEAMTAGAPVLTSSVSSLPEVAGNAALLVDPHDVRAIRDGLAAILGDPRRARALREAGPARARRYSWARSARETRDVLREISRRGERGTRR